MIYIYNCISPYYFHLIIRYAIIYITGSRTTEIDFYESEVSDNNNVLGTIQPNANGNIMLPVVPVFPSHIAPEVQYGNEKADLSKIRSPKTIVEQTDKQPEDSTLKPHITQKPEKPLAIYFKDGAEIITTSTSTETFINAETSNDFTNYQSKAAAVKDQQHTLPVNNNDNLKISIINKLESIVDSGAKQYVDPDIKFTSGHSKLFGISIEDAEKLKSTTASSLYNTRVSPTLPVWRDVDDTTTNKYPVNVNADKDEGEICIY